MITMSKQLKPYMADISFLQSVIDAYKYGAFDNKGLPIRVMYALESLSWYGNVKHYIEVSDSPARRGRGYTKKSAYWNGKKGA